MSALHYQLVESNSPAQKNVKKSSAGSQADFDSIVFYVPIETINGMTSTAVASSVDMSSAATPTLLLPGSPVLDKGRKMYVASAMSPATANSGGITANSPVARSVLSKSPLVNSVGISANSPVARSVLSESPLVNSSPLAVSPITASADLELNASSFAKNIATKPQVKRLAENPAATLVFFDLETTGLAHEIGKWNVQITEISMIAMKRKEFESSKSSELKDIRLLQKICLCTRPRARVSSGAAHVTGLNDFNLMDQEPFDQNAASLITNFLSHLPKPVCLLAHNGDCYDYPLLKAELNRLNIHLSSDILIADTLKAFRALGVPVFPPERKIAKSVKYGKTGVISYALDNLHLYFFAKKPVGSHSSEGDCIALAKVCHSMKDLILPWVDENCSTMDDVVPMW